MSAKWVDSSDSALDVQVHVCRVIIYVCAGRMVLSCGSYSIII